MRLFIRYTFVSCVFVIVHFMIVLHRRNNKNIHTLCSSRRSAGEVRSFWQQ